MQRHGDSRNSGDIIKRNGLKSSGIELIIICKGLNPHLIKSTARKTNNLPTASNITTESVCG
jgi:hypothetical protein